MQSEQPAEEQRQQEEPAPRLEGKEAVRLPNSRGSLSRANFGGEHAFGIHYPVDGRGDSRFQYGGFWFGPWSRGRWPGTTRRRCVFHCDDGYYLYNRRTIRGPIAFLSVSYSY